jgi:acyl-CoA thioester hydrolase
MDLLVASGLGIETQGLDFLSSLAIVYQTIALAAHTGKALMQKDEFSFFYRLRVRYSEIDAQGIVFNAHYLTWFDTAITEFFRNTGFSYKDLFTSRELDFHLIKATLEYLRPVHFDHVVDVGVRVARMGNSSVTFALGVFIAEQKECYCRGEIIWVCTKIGTYKSHPLPGDVIALLHRATGAGDVRPE